MSSVATVKEVSVRPQFWAHLLNVIKSRQLGEQKLSSKEFTPLTDVYLNDPQELVSVRFKIGSLNYARSEDLIFEKADEIDRDEMMELVGYQDGVEDPSYVEALLVETIIKNAGTNIDGKIETQFCPYPMEGFMWWQGNTPLEIRLLEDYDIGCVATVDEDGLISEIKIDQEKLKRGEPYIETRFDTHLRACFQALRQSNVLASQFLV